MVRDAGATRARILDAACSEFAAAGLSGARVDRIAAAAACNVRMIYAYFGNKSALFDAAYRQEIGAMAAAVPPRGEALAEWAGEVFDYHERSPGALRLATWAQLERPEAAREPLEEYAAKVRAVPGAAVEPLTATDVIVFLYAIAGAWSTTPEGLRATGPSDRSQHRSAVVTAAARILGS